MSPRGIRFSELVQLNPKVFLTKGISYPFVPMEQLVPGRRYVIEERRKIFIGGGAKFVAGDTIFARITPCLENGKIAQFRAANGQKGFGSTEYFVFRAKDGVSDPGYLYYLASSEAVKRPAIKSMVGASGRQRADVAAIRDLLIDAPTLLVQRKISCMLSAYDDLIENNTRRIQILEQMAQAIYREWFVHFRFPGHEKVKFVESPLGNIPQGWEVSTLGSLADVSWGDTSVTKESYAIEGYDAYSASGLDGKLDYFDYEKDGVVLSAIGANCGETWFAKGRWSCIKNTIRFWANSPNVSTEYLFYATKGKEFWPKRGSAQPFVSQGDARACLILVPSGTTLRAFNSFAYNALIQVDILKKKNDILRHTRDLLLPKLISGELDVSELDIEMAEKVG